MSLLGKLLRGAKWHKYRDVDGVYSDDIKDDPHKMEEVKLYLDYIKGKNPDQVHKIMEEYRLTDLQNPNHKEAKMIEIAEKLNNLNYQKEPEKPQKDNPIQGIEDPSKKGSG